MDRIFGDEWSGEPFLCEFLEAYLTSLLAEIPSEEDLIRLCPATPGLDRWFCRTKAKLLANV